MPRADAVEAGQAPGRGRLWRGTVLSASTPKRNDFKKIERLLPESQGQNLALTGDAVEAGQAPGGGRVWRGTVLAVFPSGRRWNKSKRCKVFGLEATAIIWP